MKDESKNENKVLSIDGEWDNDKVTIIGLCRSVGPAYSTYDVKEAVRAINQYIREGWLIAGHAVITADFPKLKEIGMLPVPVEQTFDTLIASHTVSPQFAQLGLLDLGSVCRFYFPATEWKSDAIFNRTKKARKEGSRDFDVLEYNGRDVGYTARLVPLLQRDIASTSQQHVYELSAQVAELNAVMYERKIKIDPVGLLKYARRRQKEQNALRATFPINPNSWQQVIPWAKESCNISIPNIKAETLNKHFGENEDFDRLIEYREGVKSLKSWFPLEEDKKKILHVTDEWIQPRHHVTGTNVDRLASSDPNVQNWPRSHEFKSIVRNGHLTDVPNKLAEVRRFVVPRDPSLLLACFDFAQIENRTVAWEAGCDAMLEAFAKATDFHRSNAARIYDKLESQITKAERHFGKTVTHASSYGETLASLAARLFGNRKKESLKEAERLQNGYFSAYPEIRAWQYHIADLVERGEELYNAFGRRRVIYAQDRHTGLKEGCHFLGCSDAAWIMKKAAVAIWRELKLVPLLLVHDEVVLEIPRGDRGMKLIKQVKEIMEIPVVEMDNLRFPVNVSIGQNYFEKKEVAA